ncbi:unnamed protein product [Closterium sp. NIES-54]
MWDPKTKKTLVSRHVKFVEDVVYKDWQQQQVQIGLHLQEIERSAVEEVQLHLDDLPGSELTNDHSGSVGQLARVVQQPIKEHLEVAKRMVRYLGSTASAGVQISAGGQLKQRGADGITPGTLKLLCFTDATWALEDEDQSSVGGYVCMVGGGPVSWRSKKQSEIAQSLAEAQYMAIYHAIKEIVLLRKLLEDMGAEQEGSTPLFSNSESAIAMTTNHILNGLNMHMKIMWHWVRQMVKEGIVELHHVKATKQAADFLTKRLPESTHWKCAKMCGMALH